MSAAALVGVALAAPPDPAEPEMLPEELEPELSVVVAAFDAEPVAAAEKLIVVAAAAL